MEASMRMTEYETLMTWRTGGAADLTASAYEWDPIVAIDEFEE